MSEACLSPPAWLMLTVCSWVLCVQDVLMDGHSGDVWFVAFHPAKPNVFATVSDSGHVHMWDASTRSMTHCAALGWTPRTVAFSTNLLPPNNTHHMAVGGLKGHIKVRARV